jgi:hypothetical protein
MPATPPKSMSKVRAAMESLMEQSGCAQDIKDHLSEMFRASLEFNPHYSEHGERFLIYEDLCKLVDEIENYLSK